MLKSPLQLIVSLLTFGLFLTTIILAMQEVEEYIPQEEIRYKSESWNFWPKDK
jgi:hypothetical protein